MKILWFIIILYKSLINIIRINAAIIVDKYFYKKKTIFFYNPRFQLSKAHNFYIKDLFDKLTFKNKIIYGYNTYINYKSNENQGFLINEYLLFLIFNIDIFISHNLCDHFTFNSKKIFIHHACYDGLLVSPDKEYQFKKRLLKYNYIFLSSKLTNNFFKYVFGKKNKNNPKIIYVGYPKFDYLLNSKVHDNEKNNIILAPTLFNSMPSLSIKNKLEEILNNLILIKNYNIIFRPHPTDSKSKFIKNLIKKYKKFNNFKFDNSVNYYSIYKNSEILITDISDTAYAYTILTNNPVLFISIDELYVNEYNKVRKLKYFHNRSKIGEVLTKVEELPKKISMIKRNIKKYKKNIKLIKKEMIYIGKSATRYNYYLKNF
jgi:hypothetical protein